MEVGNIVLYLVIAAIVIVSIGYLVYKFIKFLKLSNEDKRETIIIYLKGLVSMAEEKIGSGNGKKKMEEVEKYFNEKAPFIYKAILKVIGVENFSDLVEEALKRVKDSFEK